MVVVVVGRCGDSLIAFGFFNCIDVKNIRCICKTFQGMCLLKHCIAIK